MWFIHSRIVGGFWFLWGLLLLPFALVVALISSSNMVASHLDTKIRKMSLWGILIYFALQMATVPIIPWQ